MTRIRIALAALSIVMASTLLLASTAEAYSTSISAPVTRGGVTVGTARGLLVLGSNGWAIVGVRVTGFHAPRANHSWRARTTLASGCTDLGFDPSSDDGAAFHAIAVSAASPWRTTRIAMSSGSITTTDVVKECPAGQVPGSSLMLRLAIQDATGAHAVAGSAVLFAAG